MIKANELRLDNWYSNGEKHYTLETSSFMDFLNEAQVNNGDVINIFPIPLTPEILEKCGFEKEITNEPYVEYWWLRLGYNDWEQDFFLQLTDPDAEMDMCNIFSRDNPESNCQILNMPRYLHQLQNLYFALTGKELQYSPK